MSGKQGARAEGAARITQIGGDHVTYAAGAGPAPRATLGLPDAPAVLVGREGPAGELVALLAEGGPAVTVVAGLAGVGKSALAVATAHRAVELGWFGDRVVFLPLRGYAPGGGVGGPDAVQEVLRHLGIRDTDMPESPEGRVALYRARLAAYARGGQRVLVVADDAGSVEQVRDLVPAQGAHRLLVTSRHRLVAPGFEARLLPLDELGEEAAAELLAGAVRRVWPDDPRAGRDPEALAEVARRCGRLPLALTVAGALLAGDPGLAVGELAERLGDARTRLARLEMDAGVRAAFDLSYARLPQDQARLFRLLTVNPGPDCSTVQAGLITAEPPESLRPALAALVRASLLAEEPVGSGRWRMHDLVRLYARERGEERAEEDGREGAVEAFLEGLAGLAKAAEEALGENLPVETGIDLPALARACEWFVAERAVLLAAANLAIKVDRLDTALALTTRPQSYLFLYEYQPDAIAIALRKFSVDQQGAWSRVFADLRLMLAGPLASLEEPAEAASHLAACLAVYREGGDREGEGMVLNLLGRQHLHAKRFEEARRAHEAALEIFRELGLRAREAHVLVDLAGDLEGLGLQCEALVACRRAFALLEEAGDRHRSAMALAVLGRALWRVGLQEESLEVQTRAVDSLMALGHQVRAARALSTLAKSLVEVGRLEEAHARLTVAVNYMAEVGYSAREGVFLLDLATVCLSLGRLVEAKTAWERGCAIFAGTGERAAEAVAWDGLCTTLHWMGDPAGAVKALERTIGLYVEAGDAKREAECRVRIAGLQVEAARASAWWRRLAGRLRATRREPA
ncbi:tetratricopeptide repeat protein [Streptomyces sp. NPDC029216]|uniref:tetratricopeptide repeat protein n=1 Tax=Streptomyces sp. NPDC029216 TaxID=3154701 RepID=UPI0033C5A3AD